MKSLIVSIAVVMLFAVGGAAQNPVTPNPKTLPKDAGGNLTKLPPTAKGLFIPDLRLRGSESIEINATVPKSYRKVIFLFQNWDQFPVESLQPTSKLPSLPPDPCKQVKASTRLFAVLHAKNGEAIGCTELKPQEDFFFIFEKDKKLPAFVFVDVVDRTKATIYRSSLVSPWSGATK